MDAIPGFDRSKLKSAKRSSLRIRHPKSGVLEASWAQSLGLTGPG